MATAAAATVPVYEFKMGAQPIGCGTALELSNMVDIGIYAEGAITLGKILAYEPASEDDRRRAAWGRA